MLQPRMGGSFAPPLTFEKFGEYQALANEAEPQVKDIMLKLIEMVGVFQQTGPSRRTERLPHPSGVGTIVPLEPAEIKRIDPVVPWMRECDMYGEVFDGIDNETQKPLRDAAFHLLWFAKELTLDREPITADQL